MISQLEQYIYLLRIALQRLYILLNVKDDERGYLEDPDSPISSNNAPGALRVDTRSKSYSTGDNPYESINLGDIKRMKSTHTNRKLSNSNRFGKRSTLMEIPNPTSAAISAKNENPLPNNDYERELTYTAEPESLDHSEFVSKALANMDSFGNSESLTLTDLTSSNQLSVPRNVERGRHSHTEYRKSMAVATAYLAELGALDHFMVKHIAVINIEPFVKDYFSLEDLLELIDDKKASTLWGKFVTGLRTGGSKKAPRPKVEGTFGVPLDYLVERNGTESSLGAGPCRIRIPVFVDDCVAVLKQMGEFMRWHTDWRFCYGLQSSLDVSVEGIFRKNGNIRQLKELSDEIDRNPSRVNLTTENPIQVAALLKKFLRDLPDPLLTSKLHKLFVTSQKLENIEHRKKVLHLTCCLLPKANRDLMEVLFVFMKWVASYSHFDDNGGSKMDITNLATVLAPNVIYAKGRDPSREESMLAIEVINMLLEHHDVFSAVPNEILPFLQDVGLGHEDMSLAAREVLKKCESLMKLRKSHSTNVVPVDKTYLHTGASSSHSKPLSPDNIPPLPSL
ncbi:Rho-type GTPase activating protein Rga1 [Umbelopsis sp. WA50703]